MRLELFDGFHLSPVREGDQAAYIEHFSDKEITDFMLVIPYPYTQKDADFWVNFRLDAASKNPKETSFALRRADGFLIGGAGFVAAQGPCASHRAAIGYWLAKPYWGRGIATAAVRAIVPYGFQKLGYQRIEATAFHHNAASQRVLEKIGFTREGVLNAYYLKNGTLIDVSFYAITAPRPAEETHSRGETYSA